MKKKINIKVINKKIEKELEIKYKGLKGMDKNLNNILKLMGYSKELRKTILFGTKAIKDIVLNTILTEVEKEIKKKKIRNSK